MTRPSSPHVLRRSRALARSVPARVKRVVTGATHGVLLVAGVGVGGYLGCTGSIGDEGGFGPRSTTSPGQGPGAVGTGGSGAGAQGNAGLGGDGAAPAAASLLPARVRLLNNDEYNNSVAALLGDTTHPADMFPAPAAQLGFTNNADQVVADVLAADLDAVAQALAATAVQSLSTLLPCDPSVVGEEACATSFIAAFGPKAFRRPLTSDDQSGLLGIYTTSRQNGADFPTAIQMVLYGVLSSASFLYTTELGSGKPAGTVSGTVTTLTPYEVAATLSYLLLASPPDDALTAAAASNALLTPDQVEAQARRLLADPRAHGQVARFFREWFEIGPSNKDGMVYPNFTTVDPSFLKETPALVDDVIFNGDGTLKSLLLADYTFVDQTLATFYGLPVSVPSGTLLKVPLAGSNRTGVLSHASFLSVHGDQTMSSPILRGVFVRRRLLCENLPPPPAGVNVTPPMPTPGATSRQLFDAHVSNPNCSGCHSLIDPIGNGFENFDGEGHYRTTDNGQPVDASGVVASTEDANGNFTGVLQLAQLLAQSHEVGSCFGRMVFRFGSAQNGAATEQEFFNEMPDPIPNDLQDILVAYVRTAMFGQRLVP
jgi:hypothetical protein